VQVPAAASVTVLPDTVHNVGVVEAKLTARPEESVALSVNGAVPSV
jgi:hypothetical protein